MRWGRGESASVSVFLLQEEEGLDLPMRGPFGVRGRGGTSKKWLYFSLGEGQRVRSPA